MPLHLLGKKSWNVYNQDNIERVRRDEEKARAVQQEEELEQRDKDAAQRLKILRGGTEDEEPQFDAHLSHGQKRKHADRERNDPSIVGRSHKRRDSGDASHAPRQRSQTTITDPLDQISNMRFRDAAGRNAQTPWYSTVTSSPANDVMSVGRDVWGNEDKSRHTRDQKRLDSSDPLLAMKKGVKQLRDVERQRTEWRREREKDLNEVEELARRERHRKRQKERHAARDKPSEGCHGRRKRTTRHSPQRDKDQSA